MPTKTQPTNQTSQFWSRSCKFIWQNSTLFLLTLIQETSCAKKHDTCSGNLCRSNCTRFLNVYHPYYGDFQFICHASSYCLIDSRTSFCACWVLRLEKSCFHSPLHCWKINFCHKCHHLSEHSLINVCKSSSFTANHCDLGLLSSLFMCRLQFLVRYL